MTRPRTRANGEGTIFERADGRFVVRLYVDGRRVERTAPTKAGAKALLKALLERKAAGLAPDADRLGVGQFLAQWLETAKPGVRPNTWRRYHQLLTSAVPSLGRIPLVKLGPHHLQALYAAKLDEGLSPTTVRHLHRVIHRALGQAERWGLLGRNPAALVSPPRAARHDMRTLAPEEAQGFLDAAAGDRLEALFALAVTTGMRRGELCGLRWRDLDLDAGTLGVRQALSWTKDGPLFSEPKTARSRRSIALSKLAVDALRRHRVHQAEERLRMGQAWQDNGLVFCTVIGTPLDPRNLARRSFEPLLERAGLPRVRFHDLRHTAATLLLGQGMHPKIVSEMLGHANIAMTLDLYSHVTPTMQQQAADAMDALLGAR